MDGPSQVGYGETSQTSSINFGGVMVIAEVVDVRRSASARQEGEARFRAQRLRQLEELRLIHAVHVARIDGEDLDESDADDELVVRTQSSSRHWLLGEIDGAIRRLADGTYGRCEDCGAAVPRGRLKTIPYARRCVACQRDRSG